MLCICKTFASLPLPNEDFWKVGQTFQSAFFEALFKGVSTRFGLRNVEKCVENTLKTCSEMFVRPSKIFVWEG